MSKFRERRRFCNSIVPVIFYGLEVVLILLIMFIAITLFGEAGFPMYAFYFIYIGGGIITVQRFSVALKVLGRQKFHCGKYKATRRYDD